MRLERMNHLWLRKNNKVIREPLYTLQEIADLVGMKYDVLHGFLKGRKKGAPKPVLGPKSDLSGTKNLYKLSEFKAWIKEMEEYK
jgi:hypothetical protein